MADISKLPPPNISALPPPPDRQAPDISGLPPPDISALPPPPAVEMQKPSGVGGYLTQEDLDRIAAKHGVNAQELSEISPYFSVANPKEMGLGENIAKAGAGTAGRVLGNIPQFIYKKLQEPKMRAAIDELQAIGEEQRGLPQTIAEAVVGPGAVMRSASLPVKLAEGAVAGATYGTAASKEGQELRGAKQGATLGLVGGAAFEGIQKLAAPSGSRLSKAEAELVRGRQADIEQGIEDVSGRTQGSERALEDITFNRKETVTPQEAELIAREQLGDDTLKQYLDPSTEKGKMIRSRIEGPTTDREITQQLADDIISTRARDFAEELTGSRPKTGVDALEAIQEHASRQGAEATETSYRNFVNLKQAERYIDEAGSVARGQPGFWGQTLNKISDNQYVLRHLDDKYGINSEAILRDLNKSKNRLTFARLSTREAVDDIHKAAIKNGTDEVVQKSDKLYRALDTGDMAGLSPQELETVQAFQKYFGDVRDFANGLVKQHDPNVAPLSIPVRENYVPHVAKPVSEQIPLIERRTAEALQEASQTLGRPVDSLGKLNARELAALEKSSPAISDLVKFAKWADNSVRIRDGKDLLREIDQKLHTREGNIQLESRARAAMARTGEIPELILQKDLYKLADTYAHNTLNHLYLRNPLEKLRNESKKLRALKADAEADYVGRIVQDTLGIRKGTAAEGFMQSKIALEGKLNTLVDKYGARSPTGLALNAAKYLPEIMHRALQNIYPNLLGFGNIYAATQNLVTGFTRLAPELGTRYGYLTVLRGTLKTLMNFKEYYKVAEKLGNVPAEVIRRGEAAVAEGIFRSRAFNLPAEGYRKLAQFGMKLFEGSERLNRAITIGVADMMASDIAARSAAALGSLRKFPASIQKQVMRNPGAVESNARLLAQYLNDTTQFNYNRSSLFEFGRTLGPILSTFSKWPTAVLGEAAYAYRSGGLVRGSLRNFERLVVPFALLSTVGYLAGYEDPDSVSDVTKKFLGGRGPSTMAPVNALHGFVTGEIFTPPVVDMVFKGLVIPAASGDSDKLNKGLDTALRNYAPGTGLLRFITDDMVTYITGRRPEGSSFIERTGEGLRRLDN